ncbi:hypothetical protein THRCLA_22754 [Thraustotheca clavata]|uniref:Uncharacterized protein n=1 Tax=Thraustotheca clavata TaxID=74557 RepID=A0A1V9YU10_9STRA|nr:hypothetical protein THRCLA_22754 [Thraustotheca clavata]
MATSTESHRRLAPTYPTAKDYSSPKRNNRLYYIFLDKAFTRQYYHDASYLEPHDTSHVAPGRSKTPTYYKESWVLEIAKGTTYHSRCRQRHHQRSHRFTGAPSTLHRPSPGMAWRQWKVKTKHFLRRVHTEHHKQRRNALKAAKIRFLQAKWKLKHGQSSPADLELAKTV